MTLPGHVLIVDDDGDTREMLATLLRGAGFSVVAAEDGLEALHLLRTVCHRAPGRNLVLLDLGMPRFSGAEFRRAQLADPIVAGVPVAVMSGAVDASERADDLGAVATFVKPLDVDALLQVVHRHCSAGAHPQL